MEGVANRTVGCETGTSWWTKATVPQIITISVDRHLRNNTAGKILSYLSRYSRRLIQQRQDNSRSSSDLQSDQSSLGPCLSEGLEFGPTINQLLLQESSWQILTLKHFIIVLKTGLLTKSVQTQVPTCLKNIRQSCTLFLKRQTTKSRGKKRKLFVGTFRQSRKDTISGS